MNDAIPKTNPRRKITTPPASPDRRHISHGVEIPTDNYCDQPYIIQTDDGAWLCCLTTGTGIEGAAGQQVITMRTTDQGRTWSEPVPVEPRDPRENSYAVMIKTPTSRIYIFYTHNTDNVREIKCHDGKRVFDRVDSLGHYVLKYSDDHGRTWSSDRYDIPFRLFQCDCENIYHGKICFFFNVGKAFSLKNSAYISIHKIGQMGVGFMQQSEGALLKSDNLLTEPDPAKIRWETLPDGDVGLRTPTGGGPISEEQSYCVLSDGSIYCVYRSIDGYPVESYSRDGGHIWSAPRYKRFADGRLMKHPRAANFAWKCSNGKYLYWFHNHGGPAIRRMWAPSTDTNGLQRGGAATPYDDRNPAWLCAGIEIDTPTGREIAWSEPEIVLYDSDPFVRMSYPDLVEENGKYFLTETQKNVARIHEISTELLEGMWAALALQLGQSDGCTAIHAEKHDDQRLLSLPESDKRMPSVAAIPLLPAFRVRDHSVPNHHGKDTGAGVAIEFDLVLKDLVTSRLLLDNRDSSGRGFCLRTTEGSALELLLNDGQTENRWTSDPVLSAGRSHHVVINIDGGPRIISFVIDGRFNDGGEARQFGWGRFSPDLKHVNGESELRIAPQITRLNIFGRVLRTFEAVLRNQNKV